MVDSPRPFAALALGSDFPAVPLTAVISGPMTNLFVTFDKAIVPDLALDAANWTVRWNNINRNVIAAVSAGSIVTLTMTAGGADAGIDRVNFAPPPDDVITLENDLPVVAFTDFPVTL